MRKLFILFGFALLVAASSRAQSFELGGTYQYTHINPGGGAPSNGCQGFGGQLAANVNNWFGIAGDIGGCKVTGLAAGTSGSQMNYLFGPRLTYHGSGRFSPYFQTLMGGVHDSASATGVPTVTANAFGWTLGGGADYSLNSHWSLRAFQFEYFLTHFGGQSQNNFRIQSGLVYRWGSNKR
jgi:opacity protein-like surface antigen